jgi:hypothetical protein
MHGDVEENLDDFFSIQRISIIFQKVNSKEHLSM